MNLSKFSSAQLSEWAYEIGKKGYGTVRYGNIISKGLTQYGMRDLSLLRPPPPHGGRLTPSFSRRDDFWTPQQSRAYQPNRMRGESGVAVAITSHFNCCLLWYWIEEIYMRTIVNIEPFHYTRV